MSTALTITQQTQQLLERDLRAARAHLEVCQAYKIDSPEMYQEAAKDAQHIAKLRGIAEDNRMSQTRPLDAQKKAVMDAYRPVTEVLDQADRVIRAEMLTFKRAEDARAAQARREAEEAARREREAAERVRLEAEEAARAAQEEADRLAAAGDATAADAAAQAAEAAARAEEAHVAVEMAEVAPPPMMTIEAPRAAGVSTRQTWKAEVMDLAALVTAAAEALAKGDPTLLGYLQANEKALGLTAKALKAQARIPGVRIYAEDGLTVRRAA